MPRRLVFFLILLLPSAWYAWLNRDMPSLDMYHDDGILFVSAKSLATGQGYRILSLPSAPAQTKYPPLYPWYLSLVWRLNPRFPANLGLLALACWILLPISFALAWTYYRCAGFSERQTWVMAGCLALNPLILTFGMCALSDVFFLCWLLAAMIAIQKPGMRMAVLAGVLAGCAYLTRTIGIAMLVSVPLVLVLRKEKRRAAAFACAMLPAVVGWMMWARAHTIQTNDVILVYYTNYFRYQLLSVHAGNLALVFWKNADQALWTMGSLILPRAFSSDGMKILTQVIGVAMISGIVRLVRRGVDPFYPVYGLVSCGMLLIWNGPPEERLLLPWFPLLLAGFIEELRHLQEMLRASFGHRDWGQRAVAYGFATAVGVLIFGSALVQFRLLTGNLPASTQNSRAETADLREASDWIRANVPATEKILSGDDPLLYLYADRRGRRPFFLYRWYYEENHAEMVETYRNIGAYCRENGFSYVVETNPAHMIRVVAARDTRDMLAFLTNNPELHRVYQRGVVTVYRVTADPAAGIRSYVKRPM